MPHSCASQVCTLFHLINNLRAKPWRVFTAAYDKNAGRVLFTWELSEKAKMRRWFYTQFERMLLKLPVKSWRKVGGSVYTVDKTHSHKFREFLKSFDGPELEWCEFKIRD